METLFDKLLDINDRRVNFISDNKRIINIFRNKLCGFLRKWDEMNWEIKDCNNKLVDNILRLKEVKRKIFHTINIEQMKLMNYMKKKNFSLQKIVWIMYQVFYN